MSSISKETSIQNNEQKSKKTIKNMNPLQSVGFKLFFYIIGGILGCVIVMGVFAYNESKAIIETKVSDSSQQTISQLAINLDNIMQKYEDITLQLLVDTSFHQLVDMMTNTTMGEFERFEATKEITNKLQSII